MPGASLPPVSSTHPPTFSYSFIHHTHIRFWYLNYYRRPGLGGEGRRPLLHEDWL